MFFDGDTAHNISKTTIPLSLGSLLIKTSLHSPPSSPSLVSFTKEINPIEERSISPTLPFLVQGTIQTSDSLIKSNSSSIRRIDPKAVDSPLLFSQVHLHTVKFEEAIAKDCKEYLRDAWTMSSCKETKAWKFISTETTSTFFSITL